MEKLPNIILIVSDDHGKEAVGCYGNKVIKTPNIDSLASDGVLFTNSFCTAATCAASRTTILTGQHTHATGTYGHTHRPHNFSCFKDIKTLPALLKRQGYTTGRVGKRHYAPSDIFPFDWEHPENSFGRDDVKMAEACREFIKKDDPIFLYWCSFNPHRYEVVKNHPLKPDSFGNPGESFENDTEHEYLEEEVKVPSFLSDIPEVRAELAQYYQSISRLDRGIGRVLDILKEENKYKETLIIYISDNGSAFPQSKTTLYEPGMNLPCLVKVPGRSDARISEEMITWTDITPTILDFAGADENKLAFHGISFRPVLDGVSNVLKREEVYASHCFHEITNYYPMRVIRTKKYKFIYNIAWKLDYPFADDLWYSSSWQAIINKGMENFGSRDVNSYIHRQRFELYDIENDPDEIRNLAYEKKYNGLVQNFIKKIKKFQQDTDDPWLHKWEYE